MYYIIQGGHLFDHLHKEYDCGRPWIGIDIELMLNEKITTGCLTLS